MDLTERQRRELEYHRGHAAERYEQFTDVSFDILSPRNSRWWNAYWEMYRYFRSIDLQRMRVLVVGCGAGHDALRLKRLGADVYAFDLSPELLEIARNNAQKYSLPLEFRQMSAERLEYPDSFFDLIVIVDILHHCELKQVLRELRRVSKERATWVVNEIYTHSRLQALRDCSFVNRWLYPTVSRVIYNGAPYITEDERKLNEVDMTNLRQFVEIQDTRFFYALVKRVLPDKPMVAMLDRALLLAMKPLAPFLAGRFLSIGTVK